MNIKKEVRLRLVGGSVHDDLLLRETLLALLRETDRLGHTITADFCRCRRLPDFTFWSILTKCKE